MGVLVDFAQACKELPAKKRLRYEKEIVAEVEEMLLMGGSLEGISRYFNTHLIDFPVPRGHRYWDKCVLCRILGDHNIYVEECGVIAQ